MTQQIFSFNEALSKGIRSSYKAPKASQTFLELVNAVPQEEGLYPYEAVSNPTPSSTTSGNFVQIFRAPVGTFIFDETAVYKVTDFAEPWTLSSAISFTNLHARTSTSIPAGGRWHFVPFVSGWLAYNGSCELIYNDKTAQYYVNKKTYPLTACYYRGRVFYGGLAKYNSLIKKSGLEDLLPSSADSFNAEMGDNWVGWSDPRGLDIGDNYTPGVLIHGGGNYLVTDLLNDTGWTTNTGWTGPSSSIFTATGATGTLVRTVDLSAQNGHLYWIVEVQVVVTTGSVAVTFSNTDRVTGPTTIDESGFYTFLLEVTEGQTSTVMTYTPSTFTGEVVDPTFRKTTFKQSHSVLHDLVKTNARGYMPMGYSSDVVRIEAADDGVIVYGANNITAMVSKEETFERIELADFGIAGRGAVASNRAGHAFVDTYGRVHTIDQQFRITERDYREIFELAIADGKGDELLVNTSPYNDFFYITLRRTSSGDDRSYVLTETGLSEIGQLIISTVSQYGGSGDVGIVESSSADSYFRLTTMQTDFGVATLKLFRTLYLSIDGGPELEAKLSYRKSKNSASYETEWKTVDDRGEVDFFETGMDFTISLRSTDFTNFRIHGMHVGFDETGATNIKQHIRRR